MRTVGFIDKETLCQWEILMSEHNRILERGFRMGLLNGRVRGKSMRFSSLDHFMLQMQSKYLAGIVDDFSRFGERVTDLMKAEPNSLMWNIAGPILVERRSWSSWIRLCRQMISFLQTISAQRSERCSWPDRELLEGSMERARNMFGKYLGSGVISAPQQEDFIIDILLIH